MNDVGTEPGDYGLDYFRAYCGIGYHGDSPHWVEFFGNVAERIVSLFEPQTVLDAGCAKGILVEALVERGVDAYGIDISDHAIATASPAVRDRLMVGSLASPIEGRFDG